MQVPHLGCMQRCTVRTPTCHQNQLAATTGAAAAAACQRQQVVDLVAGFGTWYQARAVLLTQQQQDGKTLK
jgi:hypothetical protein